MLHRVINVVIDELVRSLIAKCPLFRVRTTNCLHCSSWYFTRTLAELATSNGKTAPCMSLATGLKPGCTAGPATCHVHRASHFMHLIRMNAKERLQCREQAPACDFGTQAVGFRRDSRLPSGFLWLGTVVDRREDMREDGVRRL